MAEAGRGPPEDSSTELTDITVTHSSQRAAAPLIGGYQLPTRFEMVRWLGQGGMGVVLEARDRQHGTRCAIKLLRTFCPERLMRLKNEARALQGIHHQNLLSPAELLEERGRWLLLMELVDGVDFLSYVAGDEGRLRRSLCQLVEGLMALHEAGKVHRDIKPSNVLVRSDGHLVILDFGLVVDAEEGGGERLGTAAYMAPEQAEAGLVGSAADWYSVGVVLYEALTGTRPYGGTAAEISAQRRSGSPPPPRTWRPVPLDLEELCLALLAQSPTSRPTGVEVWRRLHPAGASGALARSGGGAERAFVGRARELSRLDAALADLEANGSTLVALWGESGIGKTSLIRHFLDTARRRSPALVTLSGRCYERETVPYNAVDALIDQLSQWLDALPLAEVAELVPKDAALLERMFPVLGRLEAFASAPAAHPVYLGQLGQRQRAFAALRELLGRIALRGPLVLAIDDLQWADEESWALLREVMRPPAAPALLLLVAVRGESPDPAMTARFASLGTAVHQQLVGALVNEEARALAGGLLQGTGRPFAPMLAAEIADEAKGQPLFIAELVRHLAASPKLERSSVVKLEDALRARIGRIEPDARQLLELVAIAGRPISIEILAAAMGTRRTALGRPVNLLRAASLLRIDRTGQSQIDVYHDRIRQAVLASLDRERRRACHLALADQMERSGETDPEILLFHLRAVGEASRARRYAEVAAQRAASAFAFGRAADLYQAALRDAESPAAEQPLRVKLAQALANAGRRTEAAAAYAAAASLAPASESPMLRRAQAEQLLLGGHVAGGLEILRGELELHRLGVASNRYRTLASLLARRLQLRLRGTRLVARDPATLSPELLARIDTSWWAALGLAKIDSLGAAHLYTRQALLALEAGEPYRATRALLTMSAYLAMQGGRATPYAKKLLRRAEELNLALQHPHTCGLVASVRGLLAYFEGRFAEAVELSERALTIYAKQCAGVAWEVATTHHCLLWTLSFRGEHAELERRLPALLRSARERDDVYDESTLRLTLAYRLRLAADDLDGAQGEIAEGMRRCSFAGLHINDGLELLATNEVDLYAGRASAVLLRLEARWPALKRAFVLRVQLLRTLTRSQRGRAALAVAQTLTRSRRRQVLLRQAERDGCAILAEQIAWTRPLGLLLQAGVRSLRGDREAAMELLQRAADESEQLQVLFGAMARWRWGHLAGGEKGRAAVLAAERWLTEHGFHRPDRAVAEWAPGFSDPQP